MHVCTVRLVLQKRWSVTRVDSQKRYYCTHYQGDINGLTKLGREHRVLTIKEYVNPGTYYPGVHYVLTQVLTIQEYVLTQVLTIQEYVCVNPGT